MPIWTRSDSPIPRLSNRITRANDADRVHPASISRLLPHDPQMGEIALDEDQVQWSVADDGVGDVNVPAARVTDLRFAVAHEGQAWQGPGLAPSVARRPTLGEVRGPFPKVNSFSAVIGPAEALVDRNELDAAVD